MAAYPSYGILLDSKVEIESKWSDDVSVAGTLHSRQLRSADYYNFDLTHHLTLAEYNSLMSTYGSGERDTYTLTYHDESPAVTYSVKFVNPPQIITNFGGGRFTVRCNLRGTKD